MMPMRFGSVSKSRRSRGGGGRCRQFDIIKSVSIRRFVALRQTHPGAAWAEGETVVSIPVFCSCRRAPFIAPLILHNKDSALNLAGLTVVSEWSAI